MTSQISEFIPSLTVTEFKINVSNLDYIELGEKLWPTKDVIAINSNFIHRAFDGYERFLSKPKNKKPRKNAIPDKPVSKRGTKRSGDGTVFNACIEFTIITNDSEDTEVVRYFPRSGAIQIFRSANPIDIFLHFLYECGLPEFSSVSLTGEGKPLLLNYRFSIIFDSLKLIKLARVAHALDKDDEIRGMAPFPIHYIKVDPSDIHSKIAIVFENKIRIHLWPRSGKVNLFGAKTELSGMLVYEFIRDIFIARWDDFICNKPISNA